MFPLALSGAEAALRQSQFQLRSRLATVGSQETASVPYGCPWLFKARGFLNTCVPQGIPAPLLDQ
jgi:hypothetical protein